MQSRRRRNPKLPLPTTASVSRRPRNLEQSAEARVSLQNEPKETISSEDPEKPEAQSTFLSWRQHSHNPGPRPSRRSRLTGHVINPIRVIRRDRTEKDRFYGLA